MSQHAVLSPSGAETWMNCPGSAAMQRGLPNDANEYSDEGTAAHLLGSTCLEVGNDPWFYIGRKIIVGYRVEDEFDGAEWAVEGSAPTELMRIRRWYTVDQDMADHVQKYVDAVRVYRGDGLLMPEVRVSIEAFTGEEGAAGTSDAAIVRGTELTVVDLKYGMGVKVYAERNKQLMIYALGVREELDFTHGPFDRIRIVISQPRLDHLDEWDCTSAELDAFGEEVKAAAAKALKLYNEPLPAAIGDNCLALNPSEDACRWCKAKPHCPALAKFVQDAAGCDFEAIAPSPTPATGYFDPADLARKMAACGLIEDWIKAVRAEVERQLFAGVPIPGYKIVQGKKGNQAWEDAEAAEAFLKKDLRIKIEDRCKLELKSPTQIIKFLKAKPRWLARFMANVKITQREGQPSVAPESDRRPVWTPGDTASDFTAVSTEEPFA